MSLENLNKRNEEKFSDYIEKNHKGQPHFGEAFFKYKSQISELRQTVEHHFNSLMSSIENGLPEVKVKIN